MTVGCAFGGHNRASGWNGSLCNRHSVTATLSQPHCHSHFVTATLVTGTSEGASPTNSKRAHQTGTCTLLSYPLHRAPALLKGPSPLPSPAPIGPITSARHASCSVRGANCINQQPTHVPLRRHHPLSTAESPTLALIMRKANMVFMRGAPGARGRGPICMNLVDGVGA